MDKTIPRLFTNSVKLQFAIELRNRLDANGIKYSHVADKIGVSRAYFQKILRGDDFPSNRAIVIIAETLHTNPRELLAGIKYPENLADWLEEEKQDA